MTRSWHVVGLLTLAGASVAQADLLDLSLDTFGSLNGARFERADFRPAGSGVLQSFVRISAANQNVVQGYNTSGRPLQFDENTSATFTHDLTFGEVPQLVVDGVTYLEFMLDINQNNNNPLLSLDDVEIYTSATGGQNTSNVASLGALVYSMDAGGDNFVRLDYNLNSGSGQGDMRMLVPLSAFGGAGAGTFIYLYSRFGENNANNDGYEEWAVFGEGTIIPLPPAAMAGMVGLAAAGFARRRFGKA